jgi:AraC-like DNA-binding protein
VSCPHTIVSPAFTRHDVVIVPKELLHERGLGAGNLAACKLSARAGTGRIAHEFVQAAFHEATRLSPNSAIGVADSLIDLLLLPLREVDMTLDRVGPEAMYVRAQGFIREHLRDPELSIDQISSALHCTKRYLHMLFSDRGITVSDYIWQARLQNCRQELEAQNGKTITDLAFQSRVSEIFWRGSIRDTQGASRPSAACSHRGSVVKLRLPAHFAPQPEELS